MLINEIIHLNKIIKFYLLFNTNKNDDSSFPTVTVVLDIEGRRFGRYSTQNWCQSAIGSTISRA